ncbi:diacylglycerol/lipid kinase family protein [Brevibacterium atlanticum]|uniref:diacylglycerol/lipid kinase family protein n=1 Tax=Brevibacterium atlanticum TaxID=2697563 RepID=UPI0014248349|nr:diacylglycerol kinase family protein [Brevibacterium atlanticum]
MSPATEQATVPVILNPSARNGAVRKRIAPLTKVLAADGFTAELVESTSEEHATQLAAGFAEQGAPIVLSLGGDGMVRSVAAGLVGTDTVLGIVPGGRGNDFIGKLGIPKDVSAAAGLIAAGRNRTIDVLDLDGRVCVGNVSLGLDSQVQVFADSVKRIRGHWVYLYGLVRAIVRARRIELALTVDGERIDFRGFSAGFANSGRYGGGLRLSPAAEIDDGLIDVVLFTDAAIPLLAVELVAYMVGAGRRLHPHIRFTRAREIHIATTEPMEIVADGDAVAQTPATVRIRPAALTVRVPA